MKHATAALIVLGVIAVISAVEGNLFTTFKQSADDTVAHFQTHANKLSDAIYNAKDDHDSDVNKHQSLHDKNNIKEQQGEESDSKKVEPTESQNEKNEEKGEESDSNKGEPSTQPQDENEEKPSVESDSNKEKSPSKSQDEKEEI